MRSDILTTSTSRFAMVRNGALAFTMGLALTACGSLDNDNAEAENIDADLVDASKDPAMTGALQDQIQVDPDLTEQSNRNAAVNPQGAPNGAVPTLEGAKGGKAAANAEFEGKGMLSAPKPTLAKAGDCKTCDATQGTTLGAKAAAQSGGRGKGTCDAKLTYDMGWANRMPPEFAVYPRANVKEAAGVDGGLCDIRVVNFTTREGMKDVVDYYYTKAKRSGYSAEYQLRDGEHVLGGARDADDGAYVIFMRKLSNGYTEVDIVANNGR